MPGDDGDDVAVEEAWANIFEEAEHLVLEVLHLDQAAARQAHQISEDRAVLVDALPIDRGVVLLLRVPPQVISHTLGSNIFSRNVAAQHVVHIDITQVYSLRLWPLRRHD